MTGRSECSWAWQPGMVKRSPTLLQGVTRAAGGLCSSSEDVSSLESSLLFASAAVGFSSGRQARRRCSLPILSLWGQAESSKKLHCCCCRSQREVKLKQPSPHPPPGSLPLPTRSPTCIFPRELHLGSRHGAGPNDEQGPPKKVRNNSSSPMPPLFTAHIHVSHPPKKN